MKKDKEIVNIFYRLLVPKRNVKVLDYLLNREVDVTIKDIMDGTNLTRPSVEGVLNVLFKFELLKPAKKVGISRVFSIDFQNAIGCALGQLNESLIKHAESKAFDDLKLWDETINFREKTA